MRSGSVRSRPGTSRDAWRGSWRVALLAGRRETARSRGRSLLILLLIGLPVFGLAAAGVLLASLNASPAEDADQNLGQAVSMVAPADQSQTGEFAYTDSTTTANGAAFGDVLSGGYANEDRSRPDEVRVANGYTADEPWTSERVEATVGAPVARTAIVPLTSIDGAEEADLSERSVVLADASDPLFTGRGQLVSGRWATGPGEVAVTEVGVQLGLPRNGTVSLGLGKGGAENNDPDDSVTTQVRVVGVGKAAGGQFGSAVAVMHPTEAPQDTPWSYLVDRAEPVGLQEALGWSDHGLSVMSRAVLLDPPPEENESQDVLISLIIAMIVLGVVIETMFLAGPAFAISTTRRQRSMALASAQGAGPADLRRQVLAYAVVLATLAAAVGAALGIGSGLAFAAYWRGADPRAFLPLEVPWLPLLDIVVLAVFAAGVAAWWPARGVTHLDTMAVLRGRSVSRKVKPGMPVLGAVLIAISVVVAVMGAQTSSGGEYALVAAAAGAFFGVVLLIPWILFTAGRFADRLPSWRRPHWSPDCPPLSPATLKPRWSAIGPSRRWAPRRCRWSSSTSSATRPPLSLILKRRRQPCSRRCPRPRCGRSATRVPVRVSRDGVNLSQAAQARCGRHIQQTALATR